MTFNIAHGRGLGLYQGFTSEWRLRRHISAIADLMRDWNVDIAAFQEVDEDSHWHHGVRMMEELGALSGFENRMMGVNTRREGEKPLAYGNALFSRYPVELWDNQPFGNATLGEKGFMYAEVVVGEHLLLPIINLHLDYRSRKRRIGQIERMIDYMRARPRREDRTHLPPILCGDFNSRASEAGDAVAHLFRYMTEQEHYLLYPDNARTFPSIWPRRGIDFLFMPGDFRVSRCQVIPALLSDHMPVFIEFDMDSF
ncbi:MAG: endonuclease/exonuclease/phosphatase family protein [Opitutales bacterium]|jgi:endonuclease/exonuclease/phosphatase family metal-dependent hydrolase